MNIILAKTFIELLNARNFNKAADRLCVTQSTVTVRIAALEKELGQQLFLRDKKLGVELTVAGRKFRPYAEMLLRTWQHARQELALSETQSNMFSIGLASELWETFAKPWLLSIQKTMPNLALNIDCGRSAALLEKLSQGFLDAALLYEPSPRKGITIHELFLDRYILVSTYPRKAERWNSDYIYVRWGEDFGSQHRAIMPSDITPPVSFTDGKVALDMVMSRGGSAYFPYRQVADLIEAKKLFIVEGAGAMSRQTYIARSEIMSQHEWFNEVVDKLKPYVGEQEALNRSIIKKLSVASAPAPQLA